MSEIFALRDSGLSAFLFSDVGTEANGLGVTVLSLLARLGKDPWTEAAAWSLEPRAAAAESLAESIVQLPPSRQALADAHVTAARLVLLLPRQAAPTGATVAIPGLTGTPRAALIALCYVSLFVALNFFTTAAPKPVSSTTPVAHPVITSTK